MKARVALFVPPGICRDTAEKVFFERVVSSVAGITNIDMEEGAACATPLTDLESLSRTLGHVTLVWTITLQNTVGIVTSNFQVHFHLSRRKTHISSMKLTRLLRRLITYNGHFSVSPVKKL